MLTGQTNFFISLGWAVINSLWQLALLWVIYQLITGLYNKATASFKSKLASLLLIAGFGWFIYTFLIQLFSPRSNEEAIVSTGGIINETVFYQLQAILQPASIVYLILLLIPLFRFIKNYRYVQVIRKYGLERADLQWRLFVSKMSAHMSIGRKVQVWVSEFISSPVTIGFLKPIILLPAAAISQLNPQQVEALLLHELSHIKRYDYLINLIINFIQTILYFNPFARAFVKLVEKEREKNCDELVLQFQYCPHSYASALLQLQKSKRPQTFAVAATGKNDLLNRVELIMGMRKNKADTAKKMAASLFVIIGTILFHSFLFLPSKMIDNSQSPIRYSSFITEPMNAGEDETAYTGTIENKPASAQPKPKSENNKSAGYDTKSAETTAYISPEEDLVKNISQAGFELLSEIPQLKKYQEDQVKQAIEITKKIVSNVQWKAVEKELAEVFSLQEKKELKKKYQQQVEKINWQNWENKLRSAYDNVDWERVNNQLTNVVNKVRLDSLQQVYNEAVVNLTMAKKEMQQYTIKGIPDTDISVKMVDEKMKQAIKALNIIKASRNKKIVHL
jgi:bla regulator protein blaR1